MRCGYHGFLYDATGACIWAPGQTNVPPDARVRTYPLCERHGYIWIWMGAPARADKSAVPDFHWNDDPAWAATGARLPVGCHYMLLVDNQMRDCERSRRWSAAVVEFCADGGDNKAVINGWIDKWMPLATKAIAGYCAALPGSDGIADAALGRVRAYHRSLATSI